MAEMGGKVVDTFADCLKEGSERTLNAMDQLANQMQERDFGPADAVLDKIAGMLKEGVVILKGQDSLVLGLVGAGMLGLGVVAVAACTCSKARGRPAPRSASRKKKRSTKSKATANGVASHSAGNGSSTAVNGGSSRAAPGTQPPTSQAVEKEKGKGTKKPASKRAKSAAKVPPVETQRSAQLPREAVPEAPMHNGEAAGGTKKRVRKKKVKTAKKEEAGASGVGVNGSGSGAAATV
ncbi:unnamed protein product, partial [Discosporangium mesarthrocarpum]